jgi:hypothetical protein
MRWRWTWNEDEADFTNPSSGVQLNKNGRRIDDWWENRNIVEKIGWSLFFLIPLLYVHFSIRQFTAPFGFEIWPAADGFHSLFLGPFALGKLSRLSFVFAASVHSHAQYLCWVIHHSEKGFAIFSLVVNWNWKSLWLVTEAEEEIQIRLRFMRIYAIVCNVLVQ